MMKLHKTCYFFFVFVLLFPFLTHAQDSSPEAEKLLDEGQLLRDKEAYEEAVPFYEKALSLLKEEGDHEKVINTYNILANIRGKQSQFKKEMLYLEEAFAYGEKFDLQEKSWFHSTYTNRGEYYRDTGFFQKAYDDLSKALKLIQQEEEADPALISRQYNALGRVSSNLGSHKKAIDFFFKSLEINRKAFGENSKEVAKDFNDLGVEVEKTGDYVKAKEYQEAAIRILKKIGMAEHSDIANSYTNLGNTHYYLGDFDKADKNYRLALRIINKNLGPKSLFAAYATMNVGIIYAVKGDYENALTYFEKERKIKQELFQGAHPDLIYSYNNLGAVYNRMGDLEKSLEMHLRSVDIAKEVHPPRHRNTAKIYQDAADAYKLMGNIDSSLVYIQRSLIAGSLNFDSYELQSHPESSDYFDPANRLSCYRKKIQLLMKKAEKEGEDEVKVLTIALKQAFAAIDMLDYMRSSYKSEAVGVYWQRNSRDFYEMGLKMAHQLYEMEGDSRYIDQAFELMERNKSLFLLASVMEEKGKKFGNIPEVLLQQEDSLKQELNFYEKLINRQGDSLLIADYKDIFFRRERSYDSLINIFESNYPIYHRLKYENKNLELSRLQAEIGQEDQYWLEYFWGDSSLYALLIGKDQTSFLDLGKTEALAEDISSLRKSLYTYFLSEEASDSLFTVGKDQYQDLAYKLYEKLLAPIFTEGESLPQRLIIIPDNSIAYLPFDLLLTKVSEEGLSFASLPYLIKESSISYAYSATLWEEMRARRKADVNFEVLALAPEFKPKEFAYTDVEQIRREGLAPLKHGLREAQKIQSIMGGKTLIGEEASTQNLLELANNYGIIHFATHGKLNKENSDFSYLALAEKDDGEHELLYVNDLYNMKIPAEMVVLSACETGLGDFKYGEGISSLSRAFSYAGARSIITTLWSVNDQTTAELMEKFYQHLSEGLPKDLALQKAKLQFLQEKDNYHGHPFFWGASIPVGSMKALSKDLPMNYLLLLVLFGLLLTVLAVTFMRKKSTSGV